MLRIIAFPAAADAYTTCYYAALRARGVEVVDGIFAGRWLLANLRHADAVHLHWPSFLYSDRSRLRSVIKFMRFLFLLLLTKVRGMRLVWTAHNLLPHDRNSIPLLDVLGRKLVTSQAHAVLVHGNTAAGIVQRRFSSTKGKLTVVPHGNFIDFYKAHADKPAARLRLGIHKDTFLFLFFGQCKAYKNLEALVLAFQTPRFADSQLAIVGRFQRLEYRNRIMDLIGRNPVGILIEDRFVPDDEVQWYLTACDAVVLPYADVLTSGSAMLALSFGRPVVAPGLGHLVDVITPECGILYDPRGVEDLVEAMKEARDGHFEETRIKQHARVFTFDAAADLTIAALR